MGGGLMQLVAYGAQDIYLTGNPQITFFKVVYRRHTNFSMEAIEQTFNGSAGFGKKVVCTVSRNGDLIHRVYLQVTLPEINVASSNYTRWVNWVGHALIKNVNIEIGGQEIDKHYGDWLHIWNELTQTASKQAGYTNMVGNVDRLFRPTGAGKKIPETTLFIPLQFWFNRNPGLALPLIALQYHEVKINLEFRPFGDLIGHTGNSHGITDDIVSASLYVDYIYLDTDERRRFAQVSHEYLIEQLQFTGDESVSQENVKVKLNFNHPCKELIWVVQLDGVVSTAGTTPETIQENNSTKNTALVNGAQWFNYTDRADVTPYVQTDSLVMSDMMDGVIDTDPTDQDPDNQTFGIGTGADKAPTTFAGGDALGGDTDGLGLLSQHNPLYDTGVNPVSKAKLQLNGHDRFSVREGRYFNLVQPYQHHERVPATGINVYSFGLKPEEHQPSGTCNMSRIDNATLQLTLTKDAVTNNSGKVRVYATNYNVLRIMSGMGGLAYSN